jgi:hypothetical protein
MHRYHRISTYCYSKVSGKVKSDISFKTLVTSEKQVSLNFLLRLTISDEHYMRMVSKRRLIIGNSSPRLPVPVELTVPLLMILQYKPVVPSAD